MADRLADLVRTRTLTLGSRSVARELLAELAPADRPAVVIVPRSERPETSVRRPTPHERTMRAADGLGRALAALESADARRLR
jgi:hypothetical protein